MTPPSSLLRLLIVEDDPNRAELLQSWLPQGVRMVVATSAGRALGLLSRDRGHVYAGILLDHDLQQQLATTSEQQFSGMDVAAAIVRYVSKDVPVLIHSMNLSQAPRMVTLLETAGFYVTRIPMEKLTPKDFTKWFQNVQTIWEEFNEVFQGFKDKPG
jgi:CheY-like chemotaxis protein